MAEIAYENTPINVLTTQITKSWLKSENVSELSEALNDFAQSILSFEDFNWDLIHVAANQTQQYGSTAFDLVNFMENISYLLITKKLTVLPEYDVISKHAQSVIDAAENVVVKTDDSTVSWDNNGISIYLPVGGSNLNLINWHPFYNPQTGESFSDWGEFIGTLYEKVSGQDIGIIQHSDGMAQALVINGDILFTANDTGVLSKGFVLEQQAAYAGLSKDVFLFELSQNGSAADEITIYNSALTLDEAPVFTVKLYDASGKVLQEQNGSSITLNLNNLKKGKYSYSIETTATTLYNISYNSETVASDHMELKSKNDLQENAVFLQEGSKGLWTSCNDPDYFVLESSNAGGKVTVWGSEVSSDNIAIEIFDENNFSMGNLSWNSEKNCFEAEFSGKIYVKVQGNTEDVVPYNIVVNEQDTYVHCAAELPFNFSATLKSGEKNVEDSLSLLYPAKIRLGGDYAGLSGKLQIINAQGKVVADTTISKGTAKEKEIILEAGDYTLRFTASNKVTSDTDISLACYGTVFDKINISDDWTNMKLSGECGNIGNAGKIEKSGIVIDNDWVGFGDKIDYKMFDLVDGAKLSFTVEGSDAAKFAIYQLQEKVDKKGNVTYSLKALQNNTLKLDKASGKYIVDTKDLLLENGTYYFSMTSTNAKKGGDCDYTVTVNDDSIFFSRGDDNSNDWLYDKKSGIVNDAMESIGQDAAIALDDWVGFGDAVDYHSFELTSAAKLSFNVNADDASKFAIYQLQEKVDKKGNVSYSLKTLQSNTLKLDKTSGKYIVDTKDLLLENGTYYFSMTSTNAKKGGDCNYTVTVNDDSVFFTHGDDNSNDWLYDKKSGSINDAVGSIGQDTAIALDDWVGFGDAVDYHSFELTSAAKLSFNVNADDASKFAIYQLQEKVDKKGNVTYSLKTLQSNTLKLDKTSGKYIVDTKELLLTSGTYYVSMTSSNAKKGGDCGYCIAFGKNSEVFPAELVSNNSWQNAVDLTSSAAGVVKAWDGKSAEFNDWVGFGDAVDCVMFELEQKGKIDIDLTTEDESLRVGKDIKVKLLNENGKALALTGDMITKTELSVGTYSVMVEIANEQKYQSEYILQITSL